MENAMTTNLNTLFNRMEGFISSKTVVGEPISIGDVIILPLVDISMGLGLGVADLTNEKKDTGEKKDPDEKKIQDISGGGLGAKIIPSAVLVIVNGTVQLVNIKNQDSVNKILDMIPGLASKLNLDSLFKKKDEAKAEETIAAAVEKEKQEAEDSPNYKFGE